MLAEKINPLRELTEKSILSSNYYQLFYLSQLDDHCEDNYCQIAVEGTKKMQISLSDSVHTNQYRLNEAIKAKYLSQT